MRVYAAARTRVNVGPMLLVVDADSDVQASPDPFPPYDAARYYAASVYCRQRSVMLTCRKICRCYTVLLPYAVDDATPFDA